jgi:predicted nucleic acid-binding protein
LSNSRRIYDPCARRRGSYQIAHGLLIDSSVFIEAERTRLRLPELASDEPMALSAVTAGELLHGVHRARDSVRRARREQFVEAILERFPVVEFGLPAARAYARLWAELLSIGQPVGRRDLFIAATALAVDYGVLTADIRNFGRIPGLRVETWACHRR